jgi:O-antigen/teichoic acid export membrane protein
MYEPLGDSLKKIVRGSGIALLGAAIGILVGFITRLLIARYGLQANYGIFSLALVVLQLAAVIAGLGLNQGATRLIAYFRGSGEDDKVRGTIFTSLRFNTVTSIIIGLAIFFTADIISVNIFHTPGLAPALRTFAVGIPFITLISALAAFFRGFDRVEPGVYFQDIALSAFTLITLLIIVIMGLPFVNVFYAYLAAVIATFIAFAVYTARKLPQRVGLTYMKKTPPISKELLFFSLPLLGSTIMATIVAQTDTVMLGYFKTMETVGLYNVAYPMALLISAPINAMLLIYIPVATGQYSRNLMDELRRNYTVVTKWLVSLILPVFLVFALFPEAAIHLFFGQGYVPAATALRILSIGFIINNLLGPNGGTLIAMGHPRFILWTTLATATVNVLLNIALIPPMGMVGAAIASAISITVINIIRSVRLYSLSRAQPLSKNLLKPVLISIALALLIGILARDFITVTLWMLPLLFVFYYGIYGLATLFTKSFDKEDIALLLAIEKRSGINAAPIKKLLRRFL